MSTRVLFVTEIQVWPPFGGEKIQSYNALDSLSRCFDVTVLAPAPPAACPLTREVRRWTALPGVGQTFRARLLQSPHVLLPRTDWQQLLTDLCADTRPEVVWFDYGHWGHYAILAQTAGARTIMRTHNAQSTLTWQGLTSWPLTRWHLYYAARYPLEAWHEQTLFRRFDRVLSVTEADRRYHARFIGDEKSLYVPNYVDERLYQMAEPPNRDPNLVIMTANFGAFQNQQGAGWLLESVWPRVQAARPGTRLLLVGHMPAHLRRVAEEHPGVRCTGTAPDVTPYLRQAAVAVVPLLHGSGSRIKILEAMASELPVVSTTMGAVGIALTLGDNVLLADEPVTFADAILRLLDEPSARQRLAASGLALLRREYSLDVNTKRLRRIVGELAKVE